MDLFSYSQESIKFYVRCLNCVQLTLEQHQFELCRPTYMRMFLQNSTVDVFSLPYGFLGNIFFSVAYFIARILYLVHITDKIYVNGLFLLSVRLLVIVGY